MRGKPALNWVNGLGMALLGALVGGGAMLVAAPGKSGAGERARTEAVVRDYILSHPEILREAAMKLQGREIGEVVTANRAAFETPYAGAFAGNPKGDVTLVAFFDYSCGYCRASVPVIDRLLAGDKGLRVVYREFPVLGPDSDAAAFAALAAAQTGKYVRFHNQLFAAGRPVPATLRKVAAANGLASVQPTAEARRELDRNLQLARAIGATGTPAFIVGEQVFPGAVGYDVLKKAIGEVRAGRG